MTIVRLVSLAIFIVSCITIYHNTNSFEPKKRIIYIAIGMIVMYIITTIICNIAISNIQNKQILGAIIKVTKMIFTPVNGMIGLSLVGNTFGKAKDKTITTKKAGRRLIGILVIFICILIFETNYIGDFIKEILNTQV